MTCCSTAGSIATVFIPGKFSGDEPGRREADQWRETSPPSWLLCCIPQMQMETGGEKSWHQRHLRRVLWVLSELGLRGRFSGLAKR